MQDSAGVVFACATWWLRAQSRMLMSALGPTWQKRLLVSFTCISTARLAQSAERKALNLVVVGSSPTVGVSWICGGSCVADHLIRVCGQLMRNLQHGQHWHTHNRNVSIGENCARCVTSSSFGLHAASVISSYILSSVCSFFFITKI